MIAWYAQDWVVVLGYGVVASMVAVALTVGMCQLRCRRRQCR